MRSDEISPPTPRTTEAALLFEEKLINETKKASVKGEVAKLMQARAGVQTSNVIKKLTIRDLEIKSRIDNQDEVLVAMRKFSDDKQNRKKSDEKRKKSYEKNKNKNIPGWQPPVKETSNIKEDSLSEEQKKLLNKNRRKIQEIEKLESRIKNEGFQPNEGQNKKIACKDALQKEIDDILSL